MLLSKLTAKLTRYLNTSGGFAGLGVDDQEPILDAINAGLQEFYRQAPENMKRAPLWGVIAAPVSATIGVTAGSAVFTGITTTDDQLFASIVVNGRRNRIVAGNTLMFPWDGDTGNVDAIIYGDSATFGPEAIIDRLLSDPIITGPALIGSQLTLPAGTASPVTAQRTLSKWQELPEEQIAVGTPLWYREEDYGQTLPGRPYLALRMWPLPDVAYRFTIQAAVVAFTAALSQLVDDVTAVPVEDRHIEEFLIPICLNYLTDHRLWKLPENRPLIFKKYGTATANLKLLPKFGTVQSNRVGTPPKF